VGASPRKEPCNWSNSALIDVTHFSEQLVCKRNTVVKSLRSHISHNIYIYICIIYISLFIQYIYIQYIYIYIFTSHTLIIHTAL